MAANILTRSFKVEMSDRISIDISADIQVKRVFKRLGYIRPDGDGPEIVYAARALNPLYPGVFDSPVWEIGRKWCRPISPVCEKCPLNECSAVLK